MRWSPLLLALLPASALAGCFSPNYGNAGFTCGEAGECPSGYECQSDGICHRDGTGGGTPDATASGPDADTSGPDASVFDADISAPDASSPDATGPVADAAPVADAGPPADAQPNSCDQPDPLVEGVVTPGTILGAGNELVVSCNAADGNDAVHGFTTDAAADILVVLDPQTNWDLQASLRTQAGCETTADLACVGGASRTRYLQAANQPASDYNLVVDGTPDGNYNVRYHTRPVDIGYGYWQLRGTGTYGALSGPSVQTIPIENGFDEEFFDVELPFPFEFYGVDESSVNVHTNGFVSFDTLTPGLDPINYNNDCPVDTTTPFNLIAPFWDDLYPDDGGGGPNSPSLSTLKHEVQGVTPYRRFVIEWGNWNIVQSAPCTGPGCIIQGTGIHHQLILFEEGHIEFHFGPRSAPASVNGCATPQLGCSATIGLRNSDGTDNDVAGCSGPGNSNDLIDNGTVITYVHPSQ